MYVLGAGFCRDFNQDAFPLVSDFLRLAASHGSYKTDSELAMVIARYFGNALYGNIETVLSFLSSEPLDDLGITFERRPYLYRQLVDLIVFELNRASSIVDRNSEGAWAVYSKFIEHLINTESAVIKFNYDLLLENLLLATPAWHMVDGYGIEIPLTDEAFPTPRGVSLDFTEVPPGWKSKVLLLKFTWFDQLGCPNNRSGQGKYDLSETKRWRRLHAQSPSQSTRKPAINTAL